MNVRSIPTLAVLAATLALAGCSTDREHGALSAVAPSAADAATPAADAATQACTRGTSHDPVAFDPQNFVAGVDNKFFPLVPGTVMTYFDGTETDRVEVTHDTRNIVGVVATVVHDQVSVDGELTEDTFDWYAQDRAGNVWYLGEDSKQFENGQQVGTEGSWETGVNGAKAGIIMLAHPDVGDAYAQEDAPGVAQDQASVVAEDKSVKVPFGTFDGCLKTLETTPLEPGAREYKYYARGLGTVMEVSPGPDGSRNKLIAVVRP
jgi:hypothetical protein